MKRNQTKNLVIAALCLALGILLPQVFHAFGAGSTFLPMHIPVLLCGFLCGWQYGALCGLVVPLLSSLFTGMPPIFPTAPAMMLELCAYGLLTGLFYRRVKWNIYFSLISAMLAGRIVSGIANAAFMGIAGKAYGFSAFLTASFVTAVPGIIIQLVAVPLIVICLEKARLMESPKQNAYRVA
ncbi:MAG TPA: ECF transporter S component [Firmicutes bacterium]|nr:ECF transporter S component [Bacillota bacterium]